MNGPAVRGADGGALLAVHVAPRASRERVVGLYGDALKVAVRAPPEKGRANRDVAALLARALGARPADVAVVRGAKSRDKLVRFAGWTASALEARIAQLLVDLGGR